MFQETMRAKEVISLMALIIILYPLAEAVASDRSRQQLPLDTQIDLEMMDEDMAELLWLNCGAELMYSMEAFQDLRYSGNDKTLLGKERLLKAVEFQDPHVKKTILDCLREKHIILSKPRKEITQNWYIDYLLSFLHKPSNAPGRRRLAETVSHGTIVVAVVVTAVVTFCLAGLLFYCYIRNTAANQNNEKPLFSLSMSGFSKKSSKSKDKDGNNQLNGQNNGLSSDATVVVDSVDDGIPHVKVPPGIDESSLDPSMQPAAGRVKSSLRHTLKPRVVRAESSLRRTGKTESALRASAGKTGSPIGGGDSSPLPFPVGAESSTQQSPSNGGSLDHPPPAAAPPPPSSAPAPPPLSSAPALPSSAAAPPPPSSVQPTQPKPPAEPPPPPPPQAAAPPPPTTTGVAPPPQPPAEGAPPPPPPAGGAPPPPPKPEGNVGAPPPPPLRGGASMSRPLSGAAGAIRLARRSDQADASKAKLKPFFWDKVMAKPDKQMVWHKIKSGSFQFNEEMIESLFGYQAPEKTKDQDSKKAPAKEPPMHFIQILDPKKAQNLSILLKALNVTTEEVSAALVEGNELPIEIVQTLLKMAPTSEEELRLRLYSGDLNRLGPAERFLKALVEIPYAFRRLESLLFMCMLQEDEESIKESFETLEAACVQLKKSRLLLKLLEAVLKTGNRMNVGTFRGSATAFKLDTLLKLSDVKGVDGKTTLLHFVVQEIMRSEGIRAVRAAKEGKSICTIKTEDLLREPAPEEADEHYCKLGLEVVSGLSSELEDVKRAAIIDADALTCSVSKLGGGLLKARESLNTDMKNLQEQSEDAEPDEFWLVLSGFVENAEKEISWMLEEEKRIMALVKSTADYFHGNSGKDEGLRLFSVVRDFLIILDKVCKEIHEAPIKPSKKKEDTSSRTPKSDDLDPSINGVPRENDQNQTILRDPTT